MNTHLAYALHTAAVLSAHTGFAWSAVDAACLRCVLPSGFCAQVGIWSHHTEAERIRKADWIIRTFG